MTVGGRPLLVRTDASPAIGIGHAMRCLSLAAAYAELGGRTEFLMSGAPGPFVAVAATSDVEVRPLSAVPGSSADLDETLAAGRALEAAWIVLDGYQFDGGFQAGLVDGGARLLALDDHGHADRYHADLVLNQNAGADAALYRDRRANTRLLLGPRFAMLREEFRHWSAERSPEPPVARRVLVTLGGSDPDNVSARVLQGLAFVPDPLEIMLVVGPSNLHRAELERAVGDSPHPVEVAVNPPDMARRLAWADLAVAGAGGTAWELARVGTPHIAIVLADNQCPGAAALARAGLAVSLGWFADLKAEEVGRAVAALARDAQRRADLSRRARELVDGRGVLRVLGAMGLLAESEAAA